MHIRSHPMSCVRSADNRQTWLVVTSALRPKLCFAVSSREAAHQISSIEIPAEHDSWLVRASEVDSVLIILMEVVYCRSTCVRTSLAVWWVVSSARGEQRQSRTKRILPRHSLLLAYSRRTSSWQTSEAAVSEKQCIRTPIR